MRRSVVAAVAAIPIVTTGIRYPLPARHPAQPARRRRDRLTQPTSQGHPAMHLRRPGLRHRRHHPAQAASIKDKQPWPPQPSRPPPVFCSYAGANYEHTGRPQPPSKQPCKDGQQSLLPADAGVPRFGFDVNGQTRIDERFGRDRLDSLPADQKRMGQTITTRSDIGEDKIAESFRTQTTVDAD